MKNKISIITPCYNGEQFIRETMHSIFMQSAIVESNLELEYIIVDGDSTDNTIQYIEESMKIYKKRNCNVILISEKDNGMYDALAKGMKRVSGNICAYINADDFYNLHAFDIVSELISKNKISWLTGMDVHYNEKSEIINALLPCRYKAKFIEKGIYGKYLPFIQQESTFWNAELNSEIDLDRLKTLKYAGDYYMWFQFSKKAELNIVKAILGGFRIRRGQLSEKKEEYYKEINGFVNKKLSFVEYLQIILERTMWRFPENVNKKIIKYDIVSDTWKSDMMHL